MTKQAKGCWIGGCGCLLLVGIIWGVAAILMAPKSDEATPSAGLSGPRPATRTSTAGPVTLELGHEYVMSASNLAVLDDAGTYADEWEWKRHLVLILQPGDVVIPQDWVGLAIIRIRVASHAGSTINLIGYVPSDLLMAKCRGR